MTRYTKLVTFFNILVTNHTTALSIKRSFRKDATKSPSAALTEACIRLPQKTETKTPDFPYAAGCTSGVLKLNKATKMFIHLGGYGLFDGSSKQRSHGGYNGGGSGNFRSGTPASGGGGASDVRAEENDLFHRIIVAGGGGGGDDLYASQSNDGCGGSGGGLTAQGWYTSSTTVDNTLAANQTFGFSFGQGEAGKQGPSNHPNGSKISSCSNDLGGAGGGWFGGFASLHDNYGAGGGSSFILTDNAVIPTTNLITSDENFTNQVAGKYAFATNRKYLFYGVDLKRGVWFGNGYAEIIQYKTYDANSVEIKALNPKLLVHMILLITK